MEWWIKPKYYILILLVLYTGTLFACPFKKLVDEALSKKSTSARRSSTNDIVNDPISPAWSENKERRATLQNEWETQVLNAAEKQWKTLGVEYERVAYGDGEALRVLETGNSPLNLVLAQAMKSAKPADYPFSIVFSPRKLVREWPEEKTNYLIGGSFSPGRNTIHLPFASLRSNTLNSTFHHEFLHATFDYLRHIGQASAFHGKFLPIDSSKPMWKGPHYTEFMTLEELATFPVNMRHYDMHLRTIQANPDAAERARLSKPFINWIWGHSLTNTVNATHARNSFGHIIRHLKAKLPDVRSSGSFTRGTKNEPWSLEVTFKFANIKYTTRLFEEQFKELIPHLEIQHETSLADLDPALLKKVETHIYQHLKSQYKMAVEASDAAETLMRKLIDFRSRELTDEELKQVSELLNETRRVTLPHIKLASPQ